MKRVPLLGNRKPWGGAGRMCSRQSTVCGCAQGGWEVPGWSAVVAGSQVKSQTTPGASGLEAVLAVKWPSFFSFLFFFCFLGLYLRHMEIPRLGVESELQLPACTTATAMWDPNRVCSLYHSSRQHRILNPLIKARNRTLVLMDTSQIHYH